MLAVLCALFGCVSSTSAAATTLLSKERISVTNNENLEVCVGKDKSSYTKAFLPQPVQEFMNQMDFFTWIFYTGLQLLVVCLLFCLIGKRVCGCECVCVCSYVM